MNICKALLIVLLFIPAAYAGDTGDIVDGAVSQLGKTLIYDGSYQRLEYPMGDVPLIKGVCTDVVVRALRSAGVDLQVSIHEDMKGNISSYPNNWGLTKPDPNIDHRRVPNIITYYKRQNKTLPLPVKTENVRPGDLIAWMLPNNRPHMGVVTKVNSDGVYIVHNIGQGAKEETCLFDWEITAHIRPISD